MSKTTKPLARPLTVCTCCNAPQTKREANRRFRAEARRECWANARTDHELEAWQADFDMDDDDVFAGDEPAVEEALSVFFAMAHLRARATQAVLGQRLASSSSPRHLRNKASAFIQSPFARHPSEAP